MTPVRDTQPFVIHVDLDGAADVYKAHGWPYSYPDDPIYESGLRHMLDLLDRNDLRATLFVVADSLDDPRKLDLVREAVRRGHEIASHSLTHPNLLHLDTEQKQRELAESRAKLERLLDVTVSGFRAPGYHLDRECAALLDANGYAYDSSAFPTPAFAQRFEVPLDALQTPGRPWPDLPLTELPLPNHRPWPFPTTPSYALIFGLRYFRWGLRRIARQDRPLVLLFHLIDVADPLPADRLRGWASRLFTLSQRTAASKRDACQRMLDLVRQQYRPTTTEALLHELSLNLELNERR